MSRWSFETGHAPEEPMTGSSEPRAVAQIRRSVNPQALQTDQISLWFWPIYRPTVLWESLALPDRFHMRVS